MKRDWDVIREVLIEVEGLSDDNSDRGPNNRSKKIYGMGDEHSPGESIKSEHALLLWNAGYLSGINAGTLGGPAVTLPDLTWQGHDLLDTLRSKPVWEHIKKTAAEKGLELTLEVVKSLGTLALKSIVGG